MPDSVYNSLALPKLTGIINYTVFSTILHMELFAFMKTKTIIKTAVIVSLILFAVLGSFIGETDGRAYSEKKLKETWNCDFIYKGESPSSNEWYNKEYYFTPSVRPDVTVTAYFYEGKPRRMYLPFIPPFMQKETDYKDDFLQRIAESYLNEEYGSTVLRIDKSANAAEIIYSVCSRTDSFRKTFLKKYKNSGEYVSMDNSINIRIQYGEKQEDMPFMLTDNIEDIRDRLQRNTYNNKAA